MLKALALSAAVLMGGFFMPEAQARELFLCEKRPGGVIKGKFWRIALCRNDHRPGTVANCLFEY